MTLYFAYGSNLNIDAMRWRCPEAEPLGKIYLKDSRLVFRGVADCLYEAGAKCPGGVWRITPRCELALDRYEGINSGLYRKELVDVTGYGSETTMMLYVMNSTGIFPPSATYLQTIRQGYRDFRLPVKYLREAVQASWDNKNPSHIERQRYARKGRPRLGIMTDPKTMNDRDASGPEMPVGLFKESV